MKLLVVIQHLLRSIIKNGIAGFDFYPIKKYLEARIEKKSLIYAVQCVLFILVRSHKLLFKDLL